MEQGTQNGTTRDVLDHSMVQTSGKGVGEKVYSEHAAWASGICCKAVGPLGNFVKKAEEGFRGKMAAFG